MKPKNWRRGLLISILISAALWISIRSVLQRDSQVFIVAAKNRQRKLQVLQEQQSYKMRYEVRHPVRTAKD